MGDAGDAMLGGSFINERCLCLDHSYLRRFDKNPESDNRYSHCCNSQVKLWMAGSFQHWSPPAKVPLPSKSFLEQLNEEEDDTTGEYESENSSIIGFETKKRASSRDAPSMSSRIAWTFCAEINHLHQRNPGSLDAQFEHWLRYVASV